MDAKARLIQVVGGIGLGFGKRSVQERKEVMKIRSAVVLAVGIALSGILCCPAESAPILLTPAQLHPLAQWNGSCSGGSGLMVGTNMANLVDGNDATLWHAYDYGYSNASPTLTSPSRSTARRAASLPW